MIGAALFSCTAQALLKYVHSLKGQYKGQIEHSPGADADVNLQGADGYVAQAIHHLYTDGVGAAGHVAVRYHIVGKGTDVGSAIAKVPAIAHCLDPFYTLDPL